MRITVHHGLPLPISGLLSEEGFVSTRVPRIGLSGADYDGMRTEFLVQEGRAVVCGTPLFRDRKRPEIVITAPSSGHVEKIEIGPQRRLSLLTIIPEGEDAVRFDLAAAGTPAGLRALMQQAGLWPSLRTRPFDRIPAPDAEPVAVFVTAIDTRPLAPDPALVLRGAEDDFARGVAALRLLTQGRVYVCQGNGADLVAPQDRVSVVRFSGYHPAGLPGTHIAKLHPATPAAPVWHINYQDAAALGQLLARGTTDFSRSISLAGPGVRQPRLLRVPIGADLHALARPQLTPGPKRILSGSALDGREAQYLSRYHLQASVVTRVEPRDRNWLITALNRASAPAAFVPTAAVDRSLGPDMPAVPLLRALSIGDAERAARLGCLQLGEDDLALATYATGGETDFGARLRAVLDTLEAA